MRQLNYRYWILWLFLLGTFVIVLLQFISSYNINRLNSGNKQLLAELQNQNRLRRLEVEIVTIESDIRGAVITGNPEHIENTNYTRQQISALLDTLNITYTGSKANNLSLLNRYVQQKLAFGDQILATYKQGKDPAEALITTGRGKELRDSITDVITRMVDNRQRALSGIINSMESTGEVTRVWGVVIAAIAMIAIISAFWYFVRQGRNQQRMIAQLNQSEQRSRELARMKEQFLANMSHEIRTPMNALLGFTNILRRTKLNEDQRTYVQNIHNAGENLLALVNDILDLSKIEAGMMILEETRFSLHSLIGSVGAMFSEKIKEKGIAFAIQIDKAVPDILSGDAIRLTQILVNLLSNAVKFTEAGEIKVDVQLLNEESESATIKIAVIDSGIGIAPAKQKTIFERFQQAEAETTRRYGGSGLGLSIVKQLVELQKGAIYVNSEPGAGSEFVVELTYKLPDLNQLYSEALAAQDEIISVQEIKVLIAEDNQMNQMLISHLMNSWGIAYHLVSNGEEVIDELKRNTYSIVLMDIQMPGMDGYTATTIIRNQLKLDIPIIAMTAHAMVGEKEKCLRLGMNDYVSKPIKETVLYNIIARNAQHLPPEQVANDADINLTQLHQISGGDKNFEREMLRQFVIQVDEELNNLHRSIEQHDFDHVKSFAHSLKSTVGYIGLDKELYPYLQQIEEDAAREDVNNMEANFDFVDRRCATAKNSVKHLLDQYSL